MTEKEYTRAIARLDAENEYMGKRIETNKVRAIALARDAWLYNVVPMPLDDKEYSLCIMEMECDLD